MISRSYFIILAIASITAVLGCVGKKADLSLSRKIAKQIADGLHVADLRNLQQFYASLDLLDKNLSPDVVEALVSDYWYDSRPSAINQVWSTYTVIIDSEGQPVSPTSEDLGGTVGDCLFLAIKEQLTDEQSTADSNWNRETLRTALIKHGYSLKKIKRIP